MIITLCGSSTFKRDFETMNAKLTLEGKIVLTPAIYRNHDKVVLTKEQEQMLTKTHLMKIDMSDGIMIINRKGYVGEDTKKQIDYALSKNKTVEYMES